MKNTKIITGAIVVLIGISGCGSEDRNGLNEKGTNETVTPGETRIMHDSSNAPRIHNMEHEQVLKSFMGIPWSQASGDARQATKSQIQQNGISIIKEESKGNATKYTIKGGNFKNYPIESGWIVAENGVGIQEANLTLKPNGSDLETDYQNLVQSLTAEHGKTHESNPNGVNWYFYGDKSAVMDLIKNPQANNLRVQARSAKDIGNPYSWDHTGNQ